MNEAPNPFSPKPVKTRHGAADAKPAWIAAGLLGVTAIVMALLWATALGDARGLRAKLNAAKATLTDSTAKAKQAQDQVAALDTQVADLLKEKQSVGQAAKGLEDEMRSDLESKDVTISKLQGKLTVNILDRVMFDSGEAVLKPDGEAVLRKVAAILAEHPEIKIHVIGHTDNVPMHARYASNWELSAARAMSAVHFLTEKAGVDPRRVGAVAYGEYRPIADNATPEGRARNRRIAITILPDELAGADTAPTATNAPANLIPQTIPAAH